MRFPLFHFLCLCALPVQAQLRIVTYNTAGEPRGDVGMVLEAIGDQPRNGIAKPIDVLLLQEQDSMAGDTQDFVDLLNGIYGAGTYARGTTDADTSGAGRPGIIYNTQTVILLNETTVGTVSGSGQARQTMRYQLHPVGYDASADFYAYSSHYKASQGSSNESRRLVEATTIRGNADALGAGVQAIYAGDFNMYDSFEPGYAKLLSAGNGQAFDPISRPGDWNENAAFVDVHTQSPVTSASYGGQVTGGVDDRFDQQLVTAELMDGDGLAYIPGSYWAFGNNGTHPLNGEITSGAGASAAVLNALATSSDHLPVVVDYQVPAVMKVVVSSYPEIVPLGYDARMTFTVENVADVVSPLGADELDYEWYVTGDELLGTGSGTTEVFQAPAVHEVHFDTSTIGTALGGFFVVPTSQGAGPGFAMQPHLLVLRAGDTDQDGDVDDFDLINMITGYTGSGATGSDWTAGDHDLDGDVDDFDLIEAIVGYTGSLSAATVPEPGSLVLLLVAATALVGKRY